MCPPVNGSREEVCPGRHMGRPLQIQLKPPSTLGGAGGDRAPPLQKAKATNAQCRFEIYQAIVNLVFRKPKCPE